MDEPRPVNSTSLAIDRTILAHDRTLMAWIRTAFSMISFGFTILKTFQYLQDVKAATERHGPRNLGAALILLGTLSMFGATIQHWRFIQKAKKYEPRARFSLTLIVAILITIMGLLAFVGSFVRTGIF